MKGALPLVVVSRSLSSQFLCLLLVRRKRRLERLWEELGDPDQRKPLPILVTHAPPLRSALPAARRHPPPSLTIDMPLRPSTSPLRWRGPQGHKHEMQRYQPPRPSSSQQGLEI